MNLEAYAVMATVAENYKMKELTRTARVIPFLIMALLGYVCALTSVYFGGGWPAARGVLILTGIVGGVVFFFMGVISAIGSVVEAKKADVNVEKLRIARRALSHAFNNLDNDVNHFLHKDELNVKLKEKMNSAKKDIADALTEINDVEE